jgi:hypothetical protein
MRRAEQRDEISRWHSDAAPEAQHTNWELASAEQVVGEGSADTQRTARFDDVDGGAGASQLSDGRWAVDFHFYSLRCAALAG